MKLNFNIIKYLLKIFLKGSIVISIIIAYSCLLTYLISKFPILMLIVGIILLIFATGLIVNEF